MSKIETGVPALELVSVTRHFGELCAVENLDLNVPQGEIFGLLGPNGAGKSTLINLITGLLRRDEGEVRVLGFDPERDRQQVRRRIGLVPQHTNVYEDLSAMDNLWHHAALYCENLAVAKDCIEEQLRRMNLWDRRKDPVRTYSGGMKRRLALARALLHDPEVILFDEPTLGVDVQGKHVLWEHIKNQKKSGKTFLITTNDMSEADRLCDRLMIIDHGQSIAVETPEALKSELRKDLITLVTRPSMEDPETIFAGLDVHVSERDGGGSLRLEAAGAERIAGELVRRVTENHELESLLIARPTLDDVFLHYTGRALRES